MKTSKTYSRLSDTELHHQLLRNGFPNVPITETTRGVLLRKLENYDKRKSLEHKQKTNSQLPKTRTTINVVRHDPTIETNGHTQPASFYINNNINYTPDSRLSSRPQNHGVTYSPPKIKLPQLIHSNEPSYSAYTPSDFANQNGNPNNMHFGIVNKLLSLRKRSATYQNGAAAVTPHELLPQYKSNYLRNKLRRESGKSSFLYRVSNSLNTQTDVLQNAVPYVLLLALFLFLSFISFMYMAKSFDSWQSIDEHNTNYTLCDAGSFTIALAHSHVICLDEEFLAAGILISKELLKILNMRAKGLNCADHKQMGVITVEDFVDYLQRNQLLQNFKLQNALQIMPIIEYLIKLNPQWNMKLRYVPLNQMDPSSLATVSTKIMSEQTMLQAILYETTLPFRCILNNKMHRFFFLVGIGALAALSFLAIYISYRVYQNWQNDRIIEVETFTTSIVNELLQQASVANDFNERDVIINHLRDKLIPLKKRGSQMSSWNKALKLLEANDSRIQFGVTVHNGEEYRTMKWIENLSEASPRTSSKLWQSSAFEHTNKIVNPPTPCLKIRHMFDSSEVNNPNLKQVIENAIMEKVKSRCNILDIRLDRQTCCVYIRCASEEDAGIMHNEINGWWFDNRLVSIKFLRLQRFLSRFPK